MNAKILETTINNQSKFKIPMGEGRKFNIKTGYFEYDKKIEASKEQDKFYNKKIIGFEGNCYYVRESDKNVEEIIDIVDSMNLSITDVIETTNTGGKINDLEEFIIDNKPDYFDKETKNAEVVYSAYNDIMKIKNESEEFINKNPDCNFGKKIMQVFQ